MRERGGASWSEVGANSAPPPPPETLNHARLRADHSRAIQGFNLNLACIWECAILSEYKNTMRRTVITSFESTNRKERSMSFSAIEINVEFWL
jgi:hypothetical protein